MRAESTRIDTEDVLELRLTDGGGAAGADLELRPADGPEDAAPVPLSGVEYDGRRITVPLAGLALGDGAWELRWRAGDDAGAVTTTDPGLHIADRAAYLRRERERVLRPVRAHDGRLELRVTRARPYFEVQRVSWDGGAVEISGVPAYLRTPAPSSGDGGAVLIARQRELDGEFTAPAVPEGDAFSVRVPVEPLVRMHRSERGNNEWDLWLRPPGGPELRLAALADGVAAKKHKVAYPDAVLEEGDGAVRVVPYYTVDDELSLLAVDAEPGTDGEAL